MNYRISVDGELCSLTVEPQRGTDVFLVDIGHGVWSAQAKAVTHNLIYLTVDGRSVKLFTARENDGIWIWVNGRARFVQDADRAPRKKHSSLGETTREVTPPTPAGVVRVLVEVGQLVEHKQPVVVVSAMKMEITLTAPYAGIVRAVNTRVGAQVSPGDILVEIVPNADE